MITQQELIAIGTLRRPHGKQGEIQCQMSNELWDEAEATFLILRLDHLFVPFRVLDWRGKGTDTIIFQLQGIDSETAATRLVGAPAYMLRRDVQGDEESMMTWQDLVGYKVIEQEQGSLGRVQSIDESTINTLMELEDGRLLPIHEDFIVHIDDEQRTITLHLPFAL